MKDKLRRLKTFFNLIVKLVQNDLKARYSGSMFGIIWAYIQPLVTILVFWFVFQVGFRNPPVENVEYILWFVAGYIPWVYFSDAVNTSSNVLYEYSFLVKKMKFQTWILPIVKVMSALCIHFVFIIFIFCMYLLYGYGFQLAWLSTFFYTGIMTVLLIGLAYLCATISVFIKDFSQIVSIILQLGFWVTPIFWAPESMEWPVLRVLRCNPLYYIITGYRECMINGISFFKHTELMLWSISFSVIVLITGIFVYRKLRIHFADLL